MSNYSNRTVLHLAEYLNPGTTSSNSQQKNNSAWTLYPLQSLAFCKHWATANNRDDISCAEHWWDVEWEILAFLADELERGVSLDAYTLLGVELVSQQRSSSPFAKLVLMDGSNASADRSDAGMTRSPHESMHFAGEIVLSLLSGKSPSRMWRTQLGLKDKVRPDSELEYLAACMSKQRSRRHDDENTEEALTPGHLLAVHSLQLRRTIWRTFAHGMKPSKQETHERVVVVEERTALPQEITSRLATIEGREKLLEQREAKLHRFLSLYSLAVEQLDKVPTNDAQVQLFKDYYGLEEEHRAMEQQQQSESAASAEKVEQKSPSPRKSSKSPSRNKKEHHTSQPSRIVNEHAAAAPSPQSVRPGTPPAALPPSSFGAPAPQHSDSPHVSPIASPPVSLNASKHEDVYDPSKRHEDAFERQPHSDFRRRRCLTDSPPPCRLHDEEEEAAAVNHKSSSPGPLGAASPSAVAGLEEVFSECEVIELLDDDDQDETAALAQRRRGSEEEEEARTRGILPTVDASVALTGNGASPATMASRKGYLDQMRQQYKMQQQQQQRSMCTTIDSGLNSTSDQQQQFGAGAGAAINGGGGGASSTPTRMMDLSSGGGGGTHQLPLLAASSNSWWMDQHLDAISSMQHELRKQNELHPTHQQQHHQQHHDPSSTATQRSFERTPPRKGIAQGTSASSPPLCARRDVNRAAAGDAAATKRQVLTQHHQQRTNQATIGCSGGGLNANSTSVRAGAAAPAHPL